jgi:hypothetical protein
LRPPKQNPRTASARTRPVPRRRSAAAAASAATSSGVVFARCGIWSKSTGCGSMPAERPKWSKATASAGPRGRPCRAVPSRRRPSAPPPGAAAARARCRGRCRPSSAGPPRAGTPRLSARRVRGTPCPRAGQHELPAAPSRASRDPSCQDRDGRRRLIHPRDARGRPDRARREPVVHRRIVHRRGPTPVSPAGGAAVSPRGPPARGSRWGPGGRRRATWSA